MGTITKELTGAGIRPMRMMGNADLVMTVGRFTFSNPYTSGGEAFTAANVDMQELLCVIPTAVFSAGSGAQGGAFDAVWDSTNSNMVAVGASAQAGVNTLRREITHGTNLSAYTVRFLAIGFK